METWKTIFTEINKKEYFQDLIQFINNENRHHVVFPPKHDIFSAFRLTPFESIKVVILDKILIQTKDKQWDLLLELIKEWIYHLH